MKILLLIISLFFTTVSYAATVHANVAEEPAVEGDANTGNVGTTLENRSSSVGNINTDPRNLNNSITATDSTGSTSSIPNSSPNTSPNPTVNATGTVDSKTVTGTVSGSVSTTTSNPGLNTGIKKGKIAK